jgi:protein-S-isoprenylcysteine O-methyltransferase Ste14
MNIIKTVLFVLAVPGSVMVVIPINLILPMEKNAISMSMLAWLALLFWVTGVAVLLWCAADFARKGQGTPAPTDAPKHLVVGGLYRYVRNPMYVGVLLFSFGNAIWFGSPLLAGYAAFLWMIFHVFVLLYEEPHLRKTFNIEYQEYCQNVPRWIPRFKRIQPGKASAD